MGCHARPPHIHRDAGGRVAEAGLVLDDRVGSLDGCRRRRSRVHGVQQLHHVASSNQLKSAYHWGFRCVVSFQGSSCATSTHVALTICAKRSGAMRRAAFVAPAAGNTTSNFFSVTSRKILRGRGSPNGHTPPTGWLVHSATSSPLSILAFVLNCALNF